MQFSHTICNDSLYTYILASTCKLITTRRLVTTDCMLVTCNYILLELSQGLDVVGDIPYSLQLSDHSDHSNSISTPRVHAQQGVE